MLSVRFGISTIEFSRLYAHQLLIPFKISDNIYWPKQDKSTFKEGAGVVSQGSPVATELQDLQDQKISFPILKGQIEIWAPLSEAHIFGVLF